MFEAEITEIAHAVWESMFGVQLVASNPDAPEGPTLTGIVHIDGAWQGVVTLSCPVELAEASRQARDVGLTDINQRCRLRPWAAGPAIHPATRCPGTLAHDRLHEGVPSTA